MRALCSVASPPGRTDRIHIRDAGDERIRSRRRRSSHCLPGRLAFPPFRCHTSLRDAASPPFEQRDEMGALAFRARGLRIRSRGPRMDRIRLPLRRAGTSATLRVPALAGSQQRGSGSSDSTPWALGSPLFPRIEEKTKTPADPGVPARRAGDADDGPTTAFDLYVYRYESTVSRGQRRTPRGAEWHCRQDDTRGPGRGGVARRSPSELFDRFLARAGFASRNPCADRAGPVAIP